MASLYGNYPQLIFYLFNEPLMYSLQHVAVSVVAAVAVQRWFGARSTPSAWPD